MAKSKKVIKEFVLDSDTDSATSKVKAESVEMSKNDEKVSTDISAPIKEEPKEDLSCETNFCDTGAPKITKEKKQPNEKKPRKSKKQKTVEVPVVEEPKKAKELKVKIQKPKALTEAQMRAKIEKEYAEKENMKAKIRRELEEEYAQKHKVNEKRHFEPESEDLEETDDYDEEDLESEMDYGQTQIERGNRKAVRELNSVELMRKQIFG